MENWNSDEWQGKRKEDVELSNKLVFVSIISLIVICFIGVMYRLISL
jgi:uncharacterized membrane protein YidH (DUF202 family)